jgi:hypothetical protein
MCTLANASNNAKNAMITYKIELTTRAALRRVIILVAANSLVYQVQKLKTPKVELLKTLRTTSWRTNFHGKVRRTSSNPTPTKYK